MAKFRFAARLNVLFRGITKKNDYFNNDVYNTSTLFHYSTFGIQSTDIDSNRNTPSLKTLAEKALQLTPICCEWSTWRIIILNLIYLHSYRIYIFFMEERSYINCPIRAKSLTNLLLYISAKPFPERKKLGFLSLA